MTHYFFDSRANGRLSLDEEGVELPDVDAAHDQALGALIDMARDAVSEGKISQEFSVQVRDGIGPVLEVTGVFGSRILWKQ